MGFNSGFKGLKQHTWICVSGNKYRTRAISRIWTAVEHRNAVNLDQHELYNQTFLIIW